MKHNATKQTKPEVLRCDTALLLQLLLLQRSAQPFFAQKVALLSNHGMVPMEALLAQTATEHCRRPQEIQ
ncbi:MAG: hypothetical protein AAGJ35_11370 [Myxococcota bacterium]